MGSSANERIALHIQTSADLTGVRAARAETTGLGQAVQTAANEAAVAQQKHTLSIEQTRRATAEAGGDFEKLKAILARMVSEENALATATAKATSELRKQSSTPVLAGPAGPQLGPALPGITTGLAATAARRTTEEINKISPAARTAGNSLNMLAQAALTGQGGLAGMANAAGNVAQGIAMMSSNARLAASATGIGALIAVLGLAAAAMIRLNEEAKATQFTIDRIGKIESLSGAEMQMAVQNRRVADLQAKAQQFRQGDAWLPWHDAHKNQQELDAALDQHRTLFARITVLRKEAGEKARELAKDAKREADRIADEQRTKAKADADYMGGLSEAVASARDAVMATSEQARINAANRAAETEKAATRERKLSATDEIAAIDLIELKRKGVIALVEKERSLNLAAMASRAEASATQRDSQGADPRIAMQAKLDLIEQEYQANKKLLGPVEALAVAEEKRDRLRRQSIQQGIAGYGLLSMAVKNHGTVVGAMAKAAADAVRLHEIFVIGKKAAIEAKMQFAAATAAFAKGNAVGGALHLAAAAGYGAAAVAAGVEAAGTVSGGGSGGSAGVNDSTSFQPRNTGEGNGAFTLVLQTVNPTSREVVSEISYQLNRANVLKRPIPISPTMGLSVAAGW